MPNAKEHIRFGRVVKEVVKHTGAKLAPINKFMEDVSADVLTPVMSRLPDIIEPATSPNHRKSAHSVLMLFGVTALSTQSGKIADWLHEKGDEALLRADATESPAKAFAWRALSVASRPAAAVARHAPLQYATHLALDALTPKGLPLK